MADRLRQTARRQAATPDQFSPKPKSQQVPVSVAAQVEFARAVCRETKASLYLGPSGATRHQRAKQRLCSCAKRTESASPFVKRRGLRRGVRVNHRGGETLPCPPSSRERRPSS